TPLHFAVQHACADLARVLLEHGADVNAVNHRRNTPLMEASLLGHLPAVKVLLDNGADIEHANCRDATAVNMAIFGCHLDIIKRLVKH
ncbi:ankyrin repeat protein, partial [Ampelomyces quisqualis]